MEARSWKPSPLGQLKVLPKVKLAQPLLWDMVCSGSPDPGLLDAALHGPFCKPERRCMTFRTPSARGALGLWGHEA